MKTIDENSNFRLVWDFFILLLIIASCVLIPFQHQMDHRLGTVIAAGGSIVAALLSTLITSTTTPGVAAKVPEIPTAPAMPTNVRSLPDGIATLASLAVDQPFDGLVMSFHVVADDQLRVTRRAQSVCPLGVPYFTPIRA